jgi:hypothetical protein
MFGEQLDRGEKEFTGSTEIYIEKYISGTTISGY